MVRPRGQPRGRAQPRGGVQRGRGAAGRGYYVRVGDALRQQWAQGIQQNVLPAQPQANLLPQPQANRLNCEVCDAPCATENDRRQHMQQTHAILVVGVNFNGDPQWRCPDCSELFWTPLGVERHLAHDYGLVTHRLLEKALARDRDIYRCVRCQQELEPHAFLEHLEGYHTKLLRPFGRTMFRCDPCNFRSQSYRAFSLHMHSLHP